MQIKEMLEKQTPIFSFEFFPPKSEDGEKSLFKTIAELKHLSPAYVSVTYGAGGSTRSKTIELVSRIKHDIGIETMAHLTCVGSSRTEIKAILDELQHHGIENIIALRGDPPKGETTFVPHPDGFSYASELVKFIRTNHSFCIAGASYPEGHIECPDKSADLDHFKTKVNQGLDFSITQLFYRNDAYFDFVKRARNIGITIPILPGIMPITNLAQIKRFTSVCGATIPEDLLDDLESVDGDEAAVVQVGVNYAIAQCKELLDQGVSGIHFYTLNKSPATRMILEALEEWL